MHATLVPAELTSGSAAQISPPAHSVTAKAPLAHCAKEVPTQASSPDVQVLFAVNVANFALSCWASFPFCRAKDEVLDDVTLSEVPVALAEGVASQSPEAVTVTVTVAAEVLGAKVEEAGTVIEDVLLPVPDPELEDPEVEFL